MQGDPGSLLEGELAALEVGLADQRAQQGRLAGPVRPGQRHAVAALDLERHAVEQRIAGELLAEAGCDQDSHCAEGSRLRSSERARYRRAVSSPIVLALDVGTSSVRAHRFDGTAAEVGEPARREYAGEIDPDRLVARIREVIAEAGGAEGVEGVGTSCFGHSLLALDRQGRPLTPVLSWRDTRSADAADGSCAVSTGMRCMPAPAARSTRATGRRSWPGSRRRSRTCSAPPRASSRSATTSTNSCSAARLQRASRWHLRPGSSIFRHARGTRSSSRRSASTAERLPEISDAPVDGWYPALLDGACSNLGAGCVTRERAALMVGTSGAIRAVYETERPQPRAGLFLHWVDETRVVEGGSLSDGGNLHAWLEQTLRRTRADRSQTGTRAHTA